MSILKIDIDEKKLFQSALKGDPSKAFDAIKKATDELEYLKRKLIKQLYPEFNWMYQNVTYTWKCGTSPIGYCVFDCIDDPASDDCLFCHQPEERK